MKLRDLLERAGKMCRLYPIEIVPIDRRIKHQIDVEWAKDYDGEGPEYEYDAASEKWEPFYTIPRKNWEEHWSEDWADDPMRDAEKEVLKRFEEMKLDLNSEGWMVNPESLMHVKSIGEEALRAQYIVEQDQEIEEDDDDGT